MQFKIKTIALAVSVVALTAGFTLAYAPVTFAKEAVLAKDTYSKSEPAKFFYDKEKGWYFYEDPETGELKKLEPTEKPPVSKTKPLPTDEEYAKEHPFSAQWVRVMLPRYMDLAWNNPTPENVQAYFLVQKFAMERSQEFANTARKVILGNNLLDGSMDRPLASYGVRSTNAETVKVRNDIFKRLSEKVGIFFFFSSTCQFCEAQAPIIQMAEVNLGFKVLAVSVDGGELKSVQFGKTYRDAGHAKRLGVQRLPSIFLMNDKGEFDLIAAGVISLENLKERILIAAERNGWITKEEAAKAHFTMNGDKKTDLSKELPKLLKAAQSGDVSTLMGMDEEKVNQLKKLTQKERSALKDEDGFISPEKLLSVISKDGKAKTVPTGGKLSKKELEEVKDAISK